MLPQKKILRKSLKEFLGEQKKIFKKKKNLLHAKKQYIEYKKFILFLKIDTSPKCPKILVRSHPGESLTVGKRFKKFKKYYIYKASESIDPYTYTFRIFIQRHYNSLSGYISK